MNRLPKESNAAWAVAADAEHLRAFEACEIPRAQWDHRAHVRVGYLYLCRYRWPDALDRVRSGIQALNAVHQTPERIDRGYHETITQAFLRLLHAALIEDVRFGSSGEFCDRHPELLGKGVLLRFYSKERLFSAAAKHGFVEPDLAVLPAIGTADGSPRDASQSVDLPEPGGLE